MRTGIITVILVGLSVVKINAQAEPSAPRGLSFIGVGDMMLGTHFPSPSYLPPNDDPWPLMKEVQPVFATADVVFGNLEGAFLDEGPVFKSCRDTTKCYAFKTPTRYAPVLKKAGFNLINLANNHIRDFGPPGMKMTRYLLDSMEIPYAGLLDKPIDMLEIEGMKVGLCGFSPNTGTIKINDLENATQLVKALKRKCDFVVVSFHGGAEGRDHQHVTRGEELFYGENRGNVHAFSHAVIDAGADVVFGHGPHVTRAIEIYKGRFIAYSLGNFCTYSRFNLSGPNALTPVIQIWTDATGRFEKGQIHAFRQIKGVGTFPDPSGSVIHKIKDLTRVDFPELSRQLIIEEDGSFFMVQDRPLKSRGLIWDVHPIPADMPLKH